MNSYMLGVLVECQNELVVPEGGGVYWNLLDAASDFIEASRRCNLDFGHCWAENPLLGI